MTNAAREFPWPTVGGYDLYEVLSALQKSIRRGMEEDALFWGTELYLSDYADHAWNRLLVISSEDVGLAAPQASISVRNLHDLYNRNKKSGESRLHFDHAVSTLARATPVEAFSLRSPQARLPPAKGGGGVRRGCSSIPHANRPRSRSANLIPVARCGRRSCTITSASSCLLWMSSWHFWRSAEGSGQARRIQSG